MRAWRRPPGYRAFVVLGLLGVAGATVASAVATSDDPGSMVPLYVGVGAVGVFVVLLVALQWVGTALAARGSGFSDGPTGGGDPPRDLLAALVVDPTAGPPPTEVARKMRRGAMRLQAMVSLMALAAVVCGAAYVLGLDAVWRPFGERSAGFPVAFTPMFVLLAYGLITHRRRLRRAFEIGDQFLAPLGLRTLAVPQLVATPGGDGTTLVGSTILGGTRHGRPVEVVMEMGRHTVTVEGDFPDFAVRGTKAGRLQAHGAPRAVADRVRDITPAPRWRRVELESSGGRITVRRGAGSDARERWIDDLWLAETCAGAARREPSAAADAA